MPFEEDKEKADQAYFEVAALLQAKPAKDKTKRICKLKWRHNSEDMYCEIGKPLPSYYARGEAPALAIFDNGTVYIICVRTKNGIDPVFAGKDSYSVPTYFDK